MIILSCELNASSISLNFKLKTTAPSISTKTTVSIYMQRHITYSISCFKLMVISSIMKLDVLTVLTPDNRSTHMSMTINLIKSYYASPYF